MTTVNSEPELTWEILRSLVDSILLENSKRHLSDVQEIVLRGSYENKTYDKMEEESVYSSAYLNQDVGNKLWRALSEALGEKVTKTNFREPLRREWEKRSPVLPLILEEPDGPVDLTCSLYIERPPIESDCYRKVLQPGSLIRIRSPRRMGKTSLFNRILAYAADKGCQTVRVNLRQAEKTKFNSIDTFLRWFCTNISHQLSQEPQLDNYWDEEIGSMMSCTLYFQRHLLELVAQTNSNLVVGLDEIDWIFRYSEIAAEFLPLLRSWHEEANVNSLWKRLRLVMAHATEIYLSLPVEQSPFNVGFPIQLPEFNEQQVQQLTQLYRLNWVSIEVIEKLMLMVGGHPYLIQVALYHLACQSVSLEKFLKEAPTHAGIYRDHLRGHLSYLQQHPELASALKQVVIADSPVQLEWLRVHQLESMGLIKLSGNRVKPRCELYRQYFTEQLS